MPREIFTWAQTTRAFGLVRRWRTWKKIAYLQALSQLRLDLAEHEIAGRLEGSSHFSSTYRRTRITVLVTTCNERIDACVTSIRFRDGSGWTPNGGSRRVDPDKHSLVSHIRIDLEGNAPSIENVYGHPFLTPGPVNEHTAGHSVTTRHPSPALATLPRPRHRLPLLAGIAAQTARVRQLARPVAIETSNIIANNGLTREYHNDNEHNSTYYNAAPRYIFIIGRVGSGKSTYLNVFSLFDKRSEAPRHPPRTVRSVDMTFSWHDERPLDRFATCVLDTIMTEIIGAWKSSKIRARIFVDRHSLAAPLPFDRAFARHGHSFGAIAQPLPAPRDELRAPDIADTLKDDLPLAIRRLATFISYRRSDQICKPMGSTSATVFLPSGPPDISSNILFSNRAASIIDGKSRPECKMEFLPVEAHRKGDAAPTPEIHLH